MNLFHLDDAQWRAIRDNCLSAKRPGRRPHNARLVLSGIIHVLRSGIPWRDCPRHYGPYSTAFNYYNQLSRRGVLDCIVRQLTQDPALSPVLMRDGSPLRDYRRPGAVRSGAAGASPCTTCPVKQRSFCGRLLSESQWQRDAATPSMRQLSRAIAAGHIVQQAGEQDRHVKVLCQGWAARVVSTSSGRAQIVSFLLPGDILSTTALFDQGAIFEIKALTTLRYAVIPNRDLRRAILNSSGLAQAWGDVVSAEMTNCYQTAIDAPRQPPDERLARLIVHLMQRLAARNLLQPGSLTLPLTEETLADALALTPATVESVLDRFRANGIAVYEAGYLIVTDPGIVHRIAHAW
jgi:CRP-like cAMP-binding protein